MKNGITFDTGALIALERRGQRAPQIVVAGHLTYAQPAKIPLDEYAGIRRWLARMEAIPAWSCTRPG